MKGDPVMRENLLGTGVLIVIVVSMMFTPCVLASDENGLDLYVVTHRWSTVVSTGVGKSARVSSETLVGPAFGLQLHKCLNLNAEVLLGQPDALVDPGGNNNKADALGIHAALDYYIKHVSVPCGSLAPYITGGLGAINFEQPGADGLNEWPFTYHGGVGLRWDMPGPNFFKFHYRWVWAELEVTDQTELFDGYGISFGFSF